MGISIFYKLDKLKIHDARGSALVHVDVHFQGKIVGHAHNDVFKDQASFSGHAYFYSIGILNAEILCVLRMHVDMPQGCHYAFIENDLSAFRADEGAAGAALDIARFPQGRIYAENFGIRKGNLDLGIAAGRSYYNGSPYRTLGSHYFYRFRAGVIARNRELANVGYLVVLAEKGIGVFLGKMDMDIGTCDWKHCFHR